MKKTLTALIAAAMTFTAVSCGEKKKDSSSESINAEITTEAETTQSVEDMIDDYLPVFDSHLGIDMTAEPLPETESIPDDWQEISNGKISFRVSADVKMDDFEYEFEDGHTFKSTTAKSEDKKIFMSFFDGTDWSVEEEPTTLDSDLIGEDTIDFAKKNAEEKGYPKDGDITEEKTVRYLSEMGLEYDGTRTSLYRALLGFSSKMKTDDNSEAFEYIATLKAITIAVSFPGVYYMEADGKPVYVYPYAGAIYDPSKVDTSKLRTVWVEAFVSPDKAYTAMVRGHDMEEAMEIASTLKFVEEQG
jgi:hypothetical protein